MFIWGLLPGLCCHFLEYGGEQSVKRLTLRVLIEKRAQVTHLLQGRGSFGLTGKIMSLPEEKCQDYPRYIDSVFMCARTERPSARLRSAPTYRLV
jgi:hypothetical protein